MGEIGSTDQAVLIDVDETWKGRTGSPRTQQQCEIRSIHDPILIDVGTWSADHRGGVSPRIEVGTHGLIGSVSTEHRTIHGLIDRTEQDSPSGGQGRIEPEGATGDVGEGARTKMNAPPWVASLHSKP